MLAVDAEIMAQVELTTHLINQEMGDIQKLNKPIYTEVASVQNRHARILSLKTEEMKQILTTVKKTKIK